MTQPVPGPDAVTRNAALGEFQHVDRRPPGAGAPWPQSGHAAYYAAMAAQVYDVDGLAHECAVDAGAMRKQQAMALRQRSRQHEPTKTLEEIVRNPDYEQMFAAGGVQHGVGADRTGCAGIGTGFQGRLRGVICPNE